MAKVKELSKQAQESSKSVLGLPAFWSKKVDRESSNGSTVSSIRNRLPSTDDARDSVLSGAHRAVDRARGTVSTAIDQLPELSLPDSLQGISIPGRQKKRRRSRLLVVAVVVGASAAAYFLYRKFMGGSDDFDREDLYAENWPAQPSNTPGAGDEPHEDDATASLDAEQSAAVLNGATAAPSTRQGAKGS